MSILVLAAAALAHESVGFGFPVISTQGIALAEDLKTAIILTLFPNLAINIISVLRGN